MYRKVLITSSLLTMVSSFAHAQILDFTEPRQITTSNVTWGPTITGNGLEMYFTDWNNNQWDFRRLVRGSASDPWPDSYGEPVESLNSFSQEDEISFTTDGLTAVFNRDNELYQATRPNLQSDWQNVSSLGLNGWGASVSGDGTSVYYTRDRWNEMGADIYFATRDSVDDPFDDPEPVESINTPNNQESSPFVTSDGLTMYFVSNRPGGFGAQDIWAASRPTVEEPFEEATNLGPTINSENSDDAPFLGDGNVLYYTRNAEPGVCCFWLWEARPNDTYRQVGGEGIAGTMMLGGTQTDVEFRKAEGTYPGLLQHWYSSGNPTSFRRTKSSVYDAVDTTDNLVPDIPAIATAETWWARRPGEELDLPGYPPEIIGAARSNDSEGGRWSRDNNDNFAVVMTGELLIPESGTYRFIDGIDDFVAFGIDLDGDRIVDESEILIDDNSWTNPTRELNNGGFEDVWIPEVEFQDVADGGEWHEVLVVIGDGRVGDGGPIYWDYDVADVDGDGVRVGDAARFPESGNGEGGVISEEDVRNLMIPSSHMRSEGQSELVGGTMSAELDGSLLGYRFEVSETGEYDKLIVENPTGLLSTHIDLADANIALDAIGDPAPGDYLLINADTILGAATVIVPEELTSVFDTSRLLTEGVLTVMGDVSFDCNGDGLLTVEDLNCASPDDLAAALSAVGLLQGDANGDGEVGFADFLALSSNFGEAGSYTQGDFDRNGQIEFGDFLLLSANFGTTLDAIPVPEPSFSAMVLSVLAVACVRGRRTCKQKTR